MRIALVADIHANLQAWNAVWMDICSLGADRILCLGDVVGYGPDPAKVLQSLHTRAHHLLLGNHDAALCGRMNPALFNAEAREALRWTRARLGRAAPRFFKTLPLTIRGPGFRCAHAGFAAPGAFDYILEPDEALPSWQAVPEDLLFVGHSHVPALFLLGASGIPRSVEPQDFAVEEGKRYLVNVGSVGLPRDGDARASYCLLDTREPAVFWRRVPFDLDAFEEAMQKAASPLDPGIFRRDDPRLRLRPLRETLDFSPPRDEQEQACGAPEVADMEVWKKRAASWKKTTLWLLALTLAAAGGGLAWWWRAVSRQQVLGYLPAPLSANRVSTHRDTIALPSLPVLPGEAIPGWRLTLGDRRRQRVYTADGEDGPALVVESDNPEADILIQARPVEAAGFSRATARLLAAYDPGFAGSVEMIVALDRRFPDNSTETIERFIVREPAVPRAGGWMQAQRTERLLAHAEYLRYGIRLRFRGRVRLRGAALEPRE